MKKTDLEILKECAELEKELSETPDLTIAKEKLDRITASLAEIVEESKKQNQIKAKARELIKGLDIPFSLNYEDSIKITDLYDILTDDKKLSTMLKKLKMKAFW